jgi:hypothetical protein
MSDEKLDTPVNPVVTLADGSTVADEATTSLPSGGAHEISGDVEYKAGSTLTITPGAGSGKVLTSGATGVATWETASSGSSWTYVLASSGATALTASESNNYYYHLNAIAADFTLPATPAHGTMFAFADCNGSAGKVNVLYNDKTLSINNTTGAIGFKYISPATCEPLIIIFDSALDLWVAISGGVGWTVGF